MAKNRKLEAFVEALGIENPEKISGFSTEKIREVAGELRGFVDEAANLRAARDARRETNEALQPSQEVAKFYPTLAAFQGSIPRFKLWKLGRSIEIQHMTGQIKYPEGSTVCATPSWIRNYTGGQGVTLAPERFEREYKRYDGRPLDGQSIMLWRYGGYGDILFTRPLLAYLKSAYPTCKIMFSTRPTNWELVRSFGLVDEIVPYPFGLQDLRKADFHLSIEGLIERCQFAQRYDIHDLIAMHAGVDPAELTYWPHWSGLEWTPRPGVAVVQPSASSATRTPYIHQIVHAINELTRRDFDVVLSESPQRRRMCEELRLLCADPDHVYNHAGEASDIMGVARLIRDASVVVAPDSVFTHLAGQIGVPCLSFYGPFPARCRCTHYEKCVALEPPEHKCCDFMGRECFLHAGVRCAVNEACWQAITPEIITTGIEKVLSL